MSQHYLIYLFIFFGLSDIVSCSQRIRQQFFGRTDVCGSILREKPVLGFLDFFHTSTIQHLSALKDGTYSLGALGFLCVKWLYYSQIYYMSLGTINYL